MRTKSNNYEKNSLKYELSPKIMLQKVIIMQGNNHAFSKQKFYRAFDVF